ncbi:MAG: DUF3107 domain-containing protein [Microbacteriaceae bacterium]
MDIRIGIQNTARELAFESNSTAEQIEQQVAQALEKGTPSLVLQDVKGKRVIIPTAGIAYVEIGAEESRRVGFVS